MTNATRGESTIEQRMADLEADVASIPAVIEKRRARASRERIARRQAIRALPAAERAAAYLALAEQERVSLVAELDAVATVAFVAGLEVAVAEDVIARLDYRVRAVARAMLAPAPAMVRVLIRTGAEKVTTTTRQVSAAEFRALEAAGVGSAVTRRDREATYHGLQIERGLPLAMTRTELDARLAVDDALAELVRLGGLSIEDLSDAESRAISISQAQRS